MNKTIILKSLGLLIVILSIVFFSLEIFKDKQSETIKVNYSDFLSFADEGIVSEAIISENPKIQFTLTNSDNRYETDNPRSSTLKEDLLKFGISVSEGKYISTSNIFQTIFGLCFIAAAIFIGYKFMLKNTKKGAMAIEFSDKSESTECLSKFDDVAGNEEAKDSVADIVDFIKNPEKYSKYGARMPRGVVFYGPPGTGKTLMAKAIAGEANVPFFAVSGSDFVQMYVGVGASRIRDLFAKARESGRAVIFIDEIDALGKKRSNTATCGNDERDQTLNALLTEMSGFSSSDGIVVIAATNRLDTIDEALLRPGRFDRQVEIGLPDTNGRLSILKLHAKNKPLSNDINLDSVAKQTICFSGAMLENLLNEAAIFAAKNSLEKINAKDIERAYYTIVAGSEKKDRSGIREHDRRITAFHESGHAVAAKILSPENTVSKVTIIPSVRGAGGFCVNIPPDKMYYTKKELEAQIVVNLAGRAAEEIIFGFDEITTGASNDLEKASRIVADYIDKYGMVTDTGMKFVNAKNVGGDHSVFIEYSNQMERFYNETKKLLSENRSKLNSLANALLERDSLNEDEIENIINN